MSEPGQPCVASTPDTLTRVRVALAAVVALIVVALTGLLVAPAASAATLHQAQTAVAPFDHADGQRVGLHEQKLPGESRQRAPGYDSFVVGSCVAPETEAIGASEPGWGPGTPAVGQPPDEPTVAEILKNKLGSIQRAPLPSGSPGWSDISNMTLSEIKAGAQANAPGYRTILKLLTDSRFDK